MKFDLANVRAAMDARGLDQKKLAKVTGWSTAKVSRLVGGKTGDVTMAMVKDLMAALGVGAAYLLDIQDAAQNDTERQLLQNFRKAAERERQLATLAVLPKPDE